MNPDDDLLPAQRSLLIADISARKARILAKVAASGTSVLDAAHGETRFFMHPDVEKGLLRVTRALLSDSCTLREDDAAPYCKAQLEILRRLAAEKLFPSLLQAGIDLDASDVLVCPYGSLFLVEAALAAVAKPGGMVLCPQGLSPSTASHLGRIGLRIQTFPGDTAGDGRVDARAATRALAAPG